MIHHKILTLVVFLLYWVNTQVISSQTTEKWLPVSRIIYTSENDSTSLYMRWNDNNRLTNLVITYPEAIDNYEIVYNTEHQMPVKLIKQKTVANEIVSKEEYTISYPKNNLIIIEADTNNTAVLKLDDTGKFLTKMVWKYKNEEERGECISTFEYADQMLVSREEAYFTFPTEKYPSNEYSTFKTFETELLKKSCFQDVEQRWFITYLYLDDLTDIPSWALRYVWKGENYESIIRNITYQHNDNGFPSGWTVTSLDQNKSVACKINYIKAK